MLEMSKLRANDYQTSAYMMKIISLLFLQVTLGTTKKHLMHCSEQNQEYTYNILTKVAIINYNLPANNHVHPLQIHRQLIQYSVSHTFLMPYMLCAYF